jgi:predicted dehydrogenase
VRPKDEQAVPKHIAWDLFLGTAPQRPYHASYQPFAWRGWWDYGTGALGDMACHIMDTSYWALDLKEPTSVEAFSEGGTEESPPKWSIIRYEFPARGGRGAVKVFWYDGAVFPPAKVAGGLKNMENKDCGIVFVGEKGTIVAGLDEPPIIVEEKLAKEFKAAPKPPAPLDHKQQWVDACLGGKPATSNFDYAGPLSEMVLLGNLAIRSGKRIEWDSKNMLVTNLPEAQQYVRREYRKGWTL